MAETALLIIAGVAFAYALVARRMAATIVTAPMVFLGLGYGLSEASFAHDAREWLHIVAEITLVVVLFGDASRIDAPALLRARIWPMRMLVVGLPLAVIFGTAAAWGLLPGWTIWEAAVLAAVLAPTDAALGEAVVSNENVPDEVRRSLAAESGLNDGLALPLILFLACLAVGGQHEFQQTSWLVFAGEQIGLGLLVGASLGAAGGFLLDRAARARFTDDTTEGIAALALAAGSYLLAAELGGNGFIAAFVAGLAFGRVMGPRGHFVGEFMENEGRLFVLFSFLLIGASLLPGALDYVSVPVVIVIALSLFVVRPAAIWLSLWRTDAPPAARLFMGWFGPRGLATALFALLVVHTVAIDRGNAIEAIAVLTVLASTVLHGLTAAPAASAFGAQLLRRRIGASADPVRGPGARPDADPHTGAAGGRGTDLSPEGPL